MKAGDMKRLRFLLILLVPLLALSAFAVAATGMLPYRVYVVHTGSMTPAIPSKSAVVVLKGEYHIGEPVSFYEHGTVITHRLVGINPNGTIDTKGDANKTVDPWHVATSAIIGEVVAAPAELGYWLMYVKNPIGLASMFLCLLACWQIWSFGGTTHSAARRPNRYQLAEAE
ncbi:MAG: S24/S26 family peptidase [Terrimesophilobacter sp.]